MENDLTYNDIDILEVLENHPNITTKEIVVRIYGDFSVYPNSHYEKIIKESIGRLEDGKLISKGTSANGLPVYHSTGLTTSFELESKTSQNEY